MNDVTLTEFVLARIAEDEAVDRFGNLYNVELHAVDCLEFTSPQRRDGLCNCDGPRRWRAECEAKRRIVELHAHEQLADVIGCRTCDVSPAEGGLNYSGWCDTLRLLALPYSDHPDHREEWTDTPDPSAAGA